MNRTLIRWIRPLLLMAVALGGLGLLAVGALVLALAQMLQDSPLSFEAPQADKAALVQKLRGGNLLHRTVKGEVMTLDLPTPELNALLADVSRRSVGAFASITPHTNHTTVDAHASIPAARTPLRHIPVRWASSGWLNLQTSWQINPAGPPSLVKAQIGHVPLPNSLVHWLFDRAIAHHQFEQELDIAMQCIQKVHLQADGISIAWQWRPDLKARSMALLIPPSEHERIRVYQETLVKTIEEMAQRDPTAIYHHVPLVSLMKPLFAQAKQRAMVQHLAAPESAPPNLAAKENQAVLLVLSFYTMHVPLADWLPQAKTWPPARPLVLVLQERNDFAQHYLLSALLATGVGGRLTELIGTYKELTDTAGGSGFSFNDIAADRAGIRFGQRARYAAFQLQTRVMEGESDDFFMPKVDDLPQFLSAHEFQQRYGGPNKAAYDDLLAKINQRIEGLGVLQ